MKPMQHAKASARRYGGTPECYLAIHEFMDSTKSALADVRHRAILHSSFGCFIVERVFGVELTNSDGKKYSPRDVAEDHCIEDLGRVPSMESWLRNMRIEPWMGGPCNKNEKEKRKAQKKSWLEQQLENIQFENMCAEDKPEKFVDEANQERIRVLNEEALRNLYHVKLAKEITPERQYSSYYFVNTPDADYLMLSERHFPGPEVEWRYIRKFTIFEAEDIVNANIGIGYWFSTRR